MKERGRQAGAHPLGADQPPDRAELQERGWARQVKARVPGSANPDQYLHADWQGTVLASSGASGVGLVQNYPPRAWGQDGTTLAPFSWLGSHGYWYEGQLARTLHYVRARWYAEADPHGWISPDPLGFEAGDWNLYRYVENRPTAAVDPTGEQPWWWLLVAGGALLAAGGRRRPAGRRPAAPGPGP